MHKLIMKNKLALIALTLSFIFISACSEKRIIHSDTHSETNAPVIELSVAKDYQKDCSAFESGSDCTTQNKTLIEDITLPLTPQPIRELETQTEPASSEPQVVPNYFPTIQSIQL